MASMLLLTGCMLSPLLQAPAAMMSGAAVLLGLAACSGGGGGGGGSSASGGCGAAPAWSATVAVSSLDGCFGFAMTGAADFDYAGESVSAAGDINGDGIGDFIVGAYGGDVAYVVFGHSSGFSWPATLALSALNGSNGFALLGAASDATGKSVKAAGDVNGDGIDDLIVGAYEANAGGAARGAAYVVFGHTASWPATLALSSLDGSNGFAMLGTSDFDFAGFSVAAAGDVNDDGIVDVIVGANLSDAGGAVDSNRGASYVIFGHSGSWPATLALSSLTGSNGFAILGTADSDRSGWSVAAAGDVNGDGIDDVVIGAPYVAGGGSYRGVTYVVFGQSSGFSWASTLALSSLTGSNGFAILGAADWDKSGGSVSAAGDIDGDGIGDLIVGARYAPGGSGPGTSFVVFGHSTGSAWGPTFALSSLDGTNGFAITGVTNGDNAGMSVAAAGDVNGDGRPDLLIGAMFAGSAGTGYVVFGHSSGSSWPATLALSSLTGSNGFAIPGVASNDWTGISVSAAGDVNNDGIADLVIGASRAAAGGTRRGKAYVLFGRN